MTVARFKDLCLDATEALPLARFWAYALRGKVVNHHDGSGRVDPGRQPNEVIWIDPVPEPRTGRTRVRLDVRLHDPAVEIPALRKAGATVLDDSEAGRWVLADPDGNEFTAYAPLADLPGEVTALVVDARDPRAQAGWWSALVGGTVEASDDEASIDGVDNFPWLSWTFAATDEPKTVKNRMHWDIEFTGDPASGLTALVDAGATLVREPDDVVSWWVLTDPEGNEFCAFKPSPT